MGFWKMVEGARGVWNKFNNGVSELGNWITDSAVNTLGTDVGSLIHGFSGRTAEEQNAQQLQMQKELNEYNKQLNEKLMEREDTAYSRSISDMMSAGLNPAMLYGGSAGTLSSSAGNQLNSAPSLQALPAGSLAELAGFVINFKRMLSDINKNDAEVKNIKADTIGKNLKNVFQQVENTFQILQKKTDLIKTIYSNKATKLNNSLLEAEIAGRDRDGTYRNQPMISESSSWSGLSVSKSSSSTKPYFPSENIPDNQLIDKMQAHITNELKVYNADDRETLARAYMKHFQNGNFPLRKAEDGFKYKLYKMTPHQANVMRRWLNDTYLQMYWDNPTTLPK